MNKLLFFCVLLFCCSCKKEENFPPTNPPADTLEIKGADASYVPEIRQSGYKVRNANGQTEDMLVNLKNVGVNTIRLRIWHSPANAHSGLQEVKNFAQEIHNLGLKVLLTVHYSDSWADPGKQTKPAKWNGLSFNALKDSVYQYTKCLAQEIRPAYIQIGNEINSGLLWPDGNISKPDQMRALLAEGIRAVREELPQTKIVMHYAGHVQAAWFFDQIKTLDYDMMALSYYPIWHGKDTAALRQNMTNLINTHNKPLVIVETSYAFTLGWNDFTNNIIGLDNQLLPGIPATPQGQKTFLQMIRDFEKSTPQYAGFCYWGGEWVAFKGSTATDGSTWENQAFWGFDGGALPVLEVYE